MVNMTMKEMEQYKIIKVTNVVWKNQHEIVNESTIREKKQLMYKKPKYISFIIKSFEESKVHCQQI